MLVASIFSFPTMFSTCPKKNSIFQSLLSAGYQHFLLSHNVFYLSPKKFNFSVTFILLSANAFNLDQSKNLLFGKGLNLMKDPKFPVKLINPLPDDKF